MRAIGVFVTVALFMLSAAPPSSAEIPAGPDATTIVYVRDFGTVLSWAPVAAATGYDVYRKVDHQPPQLIATTGVTFLIDDDAPAAGRIIYSILPFSAVPGVTYSQTDCVTWRGDDVSVSVSSCASSSGPQFDPER